jgi:MinD superfamily P-loop ATPase
MNITVASGKGGTGKTTIATSLALVLANNQAESLPPLFLDCDVEAPNAHLFLAPDIVERQDVHILIPHVNPQLCNQCGVCADVCQFHAITVVGTQVLVFPQLCHGCGSCTLTCPQGAIAEEPSVLGVLEQGQANNGLSFAQGILNTGEPMAVPIIRQLKQWVTPEPDQTVVVDAPPGTSCPVVETMRGADVLLLVTEPTPFGLHDLKLAIGVVRELDIPAAVIINRDGTDYSEVDAFCAAEDIPIVLRIPFDRQLAEGIARGQTLVDVRPEYEAALRGVYEQLVALQR